MSQPQARPYDNSAVQELEDEHQKILEKEQAAHEKRQWVRLTSYCNNRCTFCLDSAAHNGTYVPRLLVRSQIIEGRRKGATRLILSGGEPTIHPNFIEFIKLGRQLGYRKIQTVTNGRLFMYREFLEKCLNAGLTEITFSIHGHDAKVHDALVGVPGAFDEEVQGLKNALADGRPIVNIDVCLNKGNIKGLPKLLDRFMELGVREFDLLHIIPFGRAFEEYRTSLFYDIDEAFDSIQYALEVAKRPDVHIWFNRFPPPYLEGHEHLIQDPYKLNDEVRGRFEEYERWLSKGQPLSCREPERCKRCYLERLCQRLEDTLEELKESAFDALRIHLAEGKGPPPRVSLPDETVYRDLWIVAPDVEAVARALPALPEGDLILELESYDRFEPGVLSGRRVLRCIAARPDDLDHLLNLEEDFEVVAVLTRETAEHLVTRYPRPPGRLVVASRNYERLTEAQARDADLEALFAAYPAAVPTENVPACLSGRPPRPRPKVLDAEALNAEGRLDIYGFTRRYILDHYYTKRRSCRECIHFDACEGAHINWVRAHGYAALEPIRAPAEAGEGEPAPGDAR